MWKSCNCTHECVCKVGDVARKFVQDTYICWYSILFSTLLYSLCFLYNEMFAEWMIEWVTSSEYTHTYSCLALSLLLLEMFRFCRIFSWMSERNSVSSVINRKCFRCFVLAELHSRIHLCIHSLISFPMIKSFFKIHILLVLNCPFKSFNIYFLIQYWKAYSRRNVKCEMMKFLVLLDISFVFGSITQALLKFKSGLLFV